jgi:hypothetical protein
MAASIGGTLDPSRGHLVMLVWDCDQRPASGISFELSGGPPSGSTRIYLRGAVISDHATETDSSGVGGFFNVPPGQVVVQASRIDTGEVLGAKRIDVVAQQLTHLTWWYADLARASD